MTEPKTFASLSPTLLARKGAAKPAMRPQLQPLTQYHDSLARVIEDDLGWNDMGHDHDVSPAETAPAVPAPSVSGAAEIVPLVPETEIAAPVRPEVLRQQDEVQRRVAAAPAPAAKAAPAPAAKAAPAPAAKAVAQSSPAQTIGAGRRSALSAGRRAAFTLRVDAERHLRLRLACTLRNRSAQQLVTDALDRLLEELPDVADLAAQVARQRN